jgi:hypothetical protein
MTRPSPKIKQTLQDIKEAMECMSGFCRACGAPRECCEPDARNYECEECGEHEVFGAEEFIMADWIKSDD